MPSLAEAEIETFFDDDDDDEESFFDDDDDDEDEGFFAEDEEGVLAEYDDDEDEAAAESDAEFYFRGRRSRGPRKTKYRRPPRSLPKGKYRLKGRRRGTVTTKNGRRASIDLGTPLATRKEVESAVNLLSEKIRKNGIGIGRLDKAVRKVDKTHRDAARRQAKLLAKFEKSTNKKLKSMEEAQKQQALLPLLLSSTPELESFKIKGQEGTIEVESSEFKSDDNFLTLALISGLAGGKGSGGGLFNDPLTALLVLGDKL